MPPAEETHWKSCVRQLGLTPVTSPKTLIFPKKPGLFVMPQKVSNLFNSIKMLIKLRAHEKKHS